MASLFSSTDESTAIIRTWWQSLEQNRGDRASMRKANSPAEVIFCPSFHRLLAQLDRAGKPEAIAAASGLVAHIKEDDSSAKLTEQMASINKSGNVKVSGLRFRRLLTLMDRNDLYPVMIRVIRMLDGKINLQDLAQSVYWWNEHTRKQWAYDYYAAAPKEP